ncbi:glycosyltransferase [Mucilaginibacter gynuensis]|uniref:Glycosyltransferase n=1 Tax=Mucilaginibacter gynuensis TaxID=1302236 RepID=A0ABP8G3K4_9SPHI
MKILHIIPAYKPAYGYGGPTESVSRLCEGLAAAGHSVDVFATTANGDKELDVVPGVAVDVDGVNVIYFKRITGDPTHVSPDLWSHLKKTAGNYDVIHVHSWWNVLVVMAARIALKSKAKVIVAPRGMLSPYIFSSGKSIFKKAIHNFIGRGILKRCVLHATAPSEYVECREIIPGWEGFVLPNIITLPDAPITEWVNDTFTLIFLSRVHPKKGLENLFRAIAKLDFNVKLKIAGSGDDDYMAELKKLTAELNIEDKVEWLGWVNREEKFKELNRSDLFVLTSLNENFANVVIESLHMGTPVLISEDVGLADFVKEKDMGWTCTLDVDSIAAQLKAAYLDTAKRTLIRNTGRDTIEETFCEKVLIDQYVAEYKK